MIQKFWNPVKQGCSEQWTCLLLIFTKSPSLPRHDIFLPHDRHIVTIWSSWSASTWQRFDHQARGSTPPEGCRHHQRCIRNEGCRHHQRSFLHQQVAAWVRWYFWVVSTSPSVVHPNLLQRTLISLNGEEPCTWTKAKVQVENPEGGASKNEDIFYLETCTWTRTKIQVEYSRIFWTSITIHVEYSNHCRYFGGHWSR